jgi:hypothetical protein
MSKVIIVTVRYIITTGEGTVMGPFKSSIELPHGSDFEGESWIYSNMKRMLDGLVSTYLFLGSVTITYISARTIADDHATTPPTSEKY